MSETVTNLKVRFGADTKNFKNDMASGKAAVTNFTGAAGGAFAQFASIFGINMGAVSGGMATANKSLALLSGGFKGAAAGSGILSGALKILKLALISTGIGAILVVLGSLVSYFTKTERGAEGVRKVMAAFGAIMDILIDRLSAFGEGIYLIFSGEFKAGWDALKGSVKGVGTEIANESAEAWKLQKALEAVQDREIALIEVQGKRRQSIEELRLAARDETLSAAERLDSIKKAIEIQKAMTADEVALQKERTRILEAQIGLGESLDSDYRALAESKAALNNIEAAGTAIIRGMSREYIKLTNEIEKETEKINKETDAVRLNAIEKEKADSKGMSQLTAASVPVKFKLVTDEKGNETWLKNAVDSLETDKLEAKSDKIKSIYGDMKSTVVDFSGIFTASMQNIAVGFGESLGNMLAGTGTLSDLGKAVGSSLGDMAIQLGTVVSAAGIAFFTLGEAFQKAISNPATALLAVAAGAALIAVGTAVKSSISSIASGSSGGTYSSGNYDTSTGSTSASASPIRSAPETIRLEGTFKMLGKDMALIIAKNKQLEYITT